MTDLLEADLLGASDVEAEVHVGDDVERTMKKSL